MAIIIPELPWFESNDGRLRSRWHRFFTDHNNTMRLVPADKERIVVTFGFFAGVPPRRLLFGGSSGSIGQIDLPGFLPVEHLQLIVNFNIDDDPGLVVSDIWLRCDGQGSDYACTEVWCCKPKL